MAYLQEILLVTVTVFNCLAAYHAVRVYKLQSARIDSLQGHIDDIKSANFGTIEDMVKPIKGYIELLDNLRNNESELVKESGAMNALKKIESIVAENSRNIEILLQTRLTNTEVFSKMTAYFDSNP